MKRVAAIGLDAAEWSRLAPLIASGELPNLARIAERSRRFELENTRGFRSEAVWTQFLTGRSSERSGYWTNVAYDPATYDVCDVGASTFDPFWVGLPDVRTIAFDIPHSAVWHRDPGTVQCTGWGAHSPLHPRAAHPAGLLSEIDERFGVHPGFLQDNTPCWWDPAFLEALTDAAEQGAARRIDVVRWLAERFDDWNLLVTVMSEAHSVGHHAWHGVDEGHLAGGAASAPVARRSMERTHRALDEAVGRFADDLPEGTHLLVFALHGMQDNTNDLPALALLPELLLRLQLGRRMLVNPRAEAWRRAGHPVEPPAISWIADALALWADSPKRHLRRLLHFSLRPRGARWLFEALGAMQRQGSPVDRFGTFPITPEVEPPPPGRYRAGIEYQPVTWYQQHWRRMDAFALPTFSDGHVRINLAGREAAGTVPASDYLAACERVVGWLRATVDPRTGQPVVEDVEVNRDPHRDGPPADVVVYWRSGIDAFEHPEAGLIGPVPLLRTGEHSSRGFALVSGPGIEPGDGGARSALDITPTIAALLGAQPDPSGDGSPLVSPAPV